MELPTEFECEPQSTEVKNAASPKDSGFPAPAHHNPSPAFTTREGPSLFRRLCYGYKMRHPLHPEMSGFTTRPSSQLGSGFTVRVGYLQQLTLYPQSTESTQSPHWGGDTPPLQELPLWAASGDHFMVCFVVGCLGRLERPWDGMGVANGTKREKKKAK